MNITVLLGLSVVAAVGGLLLKKYNPTYGVVLAVVLGACLLVGAVTYINDIAQVIDRLFQKSGIHKEWFKPMLKAIGICYFAKFGADLCRDAGETAMAGYVELTGKIMMVWLSLPLLAKIMETILYFMEL